MSSSEIRIVFGLIVPSALSKHVKFYRKDYTYVKEYDAFYKLHWDAKGLNWDSAFKSCDNEGAKLFYPSGEEWKVVKTLSNALPVAPNTTEIFVGLHDQFHIGEFITIEGKPTETPLNAVVEEGAFLDRCVMLDYITGQFKVSTCNKLPLSPNDFYAPKMPFVCKKVEETACPTIDHGYIYEESAKKCYKVNNRPNNWYDAMQTCYMEGGILAILGYEGFKPRNIFNDDNFNNMCNEDSDCKMYDCGVILPNSRNRIRALACVSDLPFVCEMDVA